MRIRKIERDERTQQAAEGVADLGGVSRILPSP